MVILTGKLLQHIDVYIYIKELAAHVKMKMVIHSSFSNEKSVLVSLIRADKTVQISISKSEL